MRLFLRTAFKGQTPPENGPPRSGCRKQISNLIPPGFVTDFNPLEYILFLSNQNRTSFMAGAIRAVRPPGAITRRYAPGHTRRITSVRAEDGRASGHSARAFTRCYLGIYNAVEPYSDRGMRKVYPVPDMPWSNVTNALQRL
jgi:hypothetical protein